MNKQKLVRIVCLTMAALMVITFLSTLFSVLFYGVNAEDVAAIPSNYNVEFRDINNQKLVTYLTKNKKYDARISFDVSKTSTLGVAIDNVKVKFEDNNTNWDANDLKVSMGHSKAGDDLYTVTVTLDKVQSKTGNLQIVLVFYNGINKDLLTTTDLFIADSYFTPPKPDSTDTKEPEVTSSTVLENYIVTDSKGNHLDTIDEKTKSFNLIVTFIEYGLEKIDVDNIPDKSLSVFLDKPGGFYSVKGTRGELVPLLSASDGAPRFKAVFKNLTYSEDLGNTVTLKMIYNINDKPVQGTLDVTVKQAKTKDKDDKDKEVKPLTPYIIVSNYSYGENSISAGSKFTLNLSYTNTSNTLNAENIMLKITPSEKHLRIGSASNTSYITQLAAKETRSQSIELQALPNAEIGSAEVVVEFKYQYLNKEAKTWEEVTTTETIAIPIIQMDRFSVDPITDIPPGAFVGETFYVSVSFINKGKSPTYNISAKATSKLDATTVEQHFGNLAAGATDSVEIPVTPKEAGDLAGEVVVYYEDENMQQKEIRQSFFIPVEDIPTDNGMDFDPSMFEDQPQGPSKITVIFSIIGGMLIAAPIGYYIIKRNSRKDSEEFNEDF